MLEGSISIGVCNAGLRLLCLSVGETRGEEVVLSICRAIFCSIRDVLCAGFGDVLRLEGLSDGQKIWVQQVINWVAVARRSLTVGELEAVDCPFIFGVTLHQHSCCCRSSADLHAYWDIGTSPFHSWVAVTGPTLADAATHMT
jgi:hypothetical protein